MGSNVAQLHRQRVAAEGLRLEGNALFAKGKYGAAVQTYTEGITMNSENTALWVNRALCYKKLGDYDKVLNDADNALHLNINHMKAHYLAGVAHHHRLDHKMAISHLQKALHAARVSGDSIKDEIWHELARAKYANWQLAAKQRKDTIEAVEAQLTELVASKTTHLSPASPDALRSQLLSVLALAREKDTVKEVPSLFVCPLTMEVYRDPAITPTGQSYERAAMLEHLSKVGKFDPITRAPVTEKDLIPNLGLRSAIEQYLDANQWAWAECI
ncbi:MAG: hypothetical protein WDW38_008067 [Sanguina aurantia]